jgi:RNA polymerase sigma-70 factor, ECF subfamily
MATADELVTVFAAAWSGHGPVEPGVADRLAELCRDARRAHPCGIEDELLVAAIAARAPAGELTAYLARCRAGDLALALATTRGSGAAIAELERSHGAVIEAVVRRFVGASHTADDLRQILRARLFVAEPEREPKIADYAGQGFLENWLRVTAMRVFLDLDKRKDRSRELPADDDDLLALPEPADLELDLVKAEYRAAVASAIADAARQLEPGDRHLLRQHYAAGLSIDQLGAALGIHRATAARRLASAREQLAAATRRLVAERLALDAGELEAVIGLVMSRLEVSIAKLLASRGPG